MSNTFTPKNIRRGRSLPNRLVIAAGLLAGVWFGTLSAAETVDEKTARLGFAFDPLGNDAAVTAPVANGEGETLGPGTLADGVIRLPKYIVTGERMPFTARELLTPEGRIAIAKKRYTSAVYQKTFGPLSNIYALIYNPQGGWNPNTPEAMALYEDAEQMRRNQEMKELMRLDALTEKKTKPAAVLATK